MADSTHELHSCRAVTTLADRRFPPRTVEQGTQMADGLEEYHSGYSTETINGRLGAIIAAKGDDPDLRFLLVQLHFCSMLLRNLMADFDAKMPPDPASASNARLLAMLSEEGTALDQFAKAMGDEYYEGLP